MCYFSLTHRSLNMLAAIEGCLEKLFETIESLPREKVEAAEKVIPIQFHKLESLACETNSHMHEVTSIIL